jgi:ABC-2 type transport system permease protein
MGLLRSRRYRDLTIIAFALFGSLCSIGQQLVVRQFNTFDARDLARIHVAQYLRFAPPGMAGWAIVRANQGAWGSALEWLAVSAALTIPVLWAWMVLLERGLAVAESGTPRARRQRQRPQASLGAQNGRVVSPQSADLLTATQAEGIANRTGSIPPLESTHIGIPATRKAAQTGSGRRMLPLPVRAIFIKEMRYFWRDPQMKASMLSSFFILIVLFVGPAFGARSGGPDAHPWTVLLSCLAPLFLAMNFSLNTFGLERQALTTLFLFPVRPEYILWGKNLALASVAFGEQLLIATAFAVITNGWGYYVPAIVVGAAAIAVMLGCGNILSVVLPFRAPQLKMGASASGSPESGCLRSLMGMFSLGVTLVVLAPVIAGVVLPLTLKTPAILTITLPLALLYGLGIHLGATRFIAPRLVQRIPEILTQTTRE